MQRIDSVLSELHMIEEIISNASECQFVVLRPSRPNIVDGADVSSDEDSDDVSSIASTIKNLELDNEGNEIEVVNGEVVEVTHVEDFETVFVGPVKYDV